MKSIALVFTTLLLSIFNLNAQDLEDTLLWEISGNGLEESSYLYGTIHITCDATLSSKILKALDNTEQLVLELDMDDINMQAEAMKLMMLKDGQTLSDFLSDEDFKTLDKFTTEKLGMPLKMLNNMKPFFINAMFYQIMLDCPLESFETELMKITKEQEEEVLGLETVAEQIQVFDDIPYEDQLKDIIRGATDNLEYDKAFFESMLEAYADEDLNKLNEIMKDESYEVSSKHADKLLENRNKNWIPKIESIAKEKATFFGVGAGHLPGKYGVIELLKAQGYTVKPITE